MTLRDHALGAFWGLALGDALGMPTQSMSRRAIHETYGEIRGLRDASTDQPIAPGMPAGSVTDDTEQAVLLGRLLVEGHGRVDPRRFADALDAWQDAMKAKGSLDLLGPSTNAAIDAIRAGVAPGEAGRRGATNGAAMRIAPVGIAVPPDPERLLDAVVEASHVTHNTGLGLAAAAAVAAAVSAGIEGDSWESTLTQAISLAEIAATRGAWIAGGSIAARIAWATAAVRELDEVEALDFVSDVMGTSVASQESVVAAFALADRFGADPHEALLRAAALGGDTDTIAAIIGAVLGAHRGMGAWPSGAVTQVATVNDLDLAPLVDDLLALRHR